MRRTWMIDNVIFLWDRVLFRKGTLFRFFIIFDRTAKIPMGNAVLINRTPTRKIDFGAYFSARMHIIWHSSKVILLNISTSKGPLRPLLSSLTNIAIPSQRLSAKTTIKIFFDYKYESANLTIIMKEYVVHIPFKQVFSR